MIKGDVYKIQQKQFLPICKDKIRKKYKIKNSKVIDKFKLPMVW